MGIGTFIYNICLGPLTLFFEMVFHTADRLVGNHGVAIIILSLVINLLILPLYNRADSLQRQQRELEKKLQPGIDHIKKTFTGDERFMMIQTYYRQNNYSPLSSLKGATSLLLQIPFFICAYRMLSSLSILNGVSFGPISDLGSPDKLLVIGSFSINILPILMTIINVVSGTVYTKDLSRKDRIRIYILALIFLVLLYNSPAGLTFYWTLNNLFSLCKNIVSSIIQNKSVSTKKTKPDTKIQTTYKPYLLSGIYISIFTGIFIPAYFLASSPVECIDYLLLDNPMKYVLYSLSLAIGTFVVWASLIYYLATPKIRRILSMIAPGLVAYFTINCFQYRGGLFNFSINMTTTQGTGLSFPNGIMLMNLIILILCLAFSVYLFIRMRFALYTLMGVGIAAMLFIGIYTTNNGSNIYKNTVIVPNKESISIPLSSTEQNVVVIMLDRATGYQMENVMAMYPELEEEFDGFTYYPNTASFGVCTNIGAPALFGGYEYIPEITNSRSDLSLEEKHNESLLVMPSVFSENGYDVTVIDPPYAGYQEYPDLTIYDDYANVRAFSTLNGELNENRDIMENQINGIKERNLFCYSLLCIVPPCLADFVYDNGNYNQVEPSSYVVQCISGDKITGADYNSVRSYEVLNSLSDITEIHSEGSGDVLILQNGLCHDENLFQEPDMTISHDINSEGCISDQLVDNIPDKLRLNVKVASLMLLGDWFNHLRENNCYDNTRIIIVSDHGFETRIPEYDISGSQNLGRFMPLLLVKDFNSTGFTVSDELMTNADTPYLAMQGLIDEPVNPFTGHSISRRWLEHGTLNVFNSYSRDVLQESGTTFSSGDWFTVHDDVRDPDNWTHYDNYSDIPQ